MSRDRLERVSIPEAASRLGITQSAVRQRIRRDSISWDKGQDGRTYVYVRPSETSARHVNDTSRDELIEELRDRVRSLEEQIARRDAIMLSLTESIRQLEARSEPREPAETTAEATNTTTEPRSATEEQQEPTSQPQEEQRSWWRRVFRG